MAATVRLAGRGGVTSEPVLSARQYKRMEKLMASVVRWEGAVDQLRDRSFTADVIDLDNNERASIELSYNAVSTDDRPLVQPGGLFFWTITGDRSEFHFRRATT